MMNAVFITMISLLLDYFVLPPFLNHAFRILTSGPINMSADQPNQRPAKAPIDPFFRKLPDSINSPVKGMYERSWELEKRKKQKKDMPFV
jgi:hypothetical protein